MFYAYIQIFFPTYITITTYYYLQTLLIHKLIFSNNVTEVIVKVPFFAFCASIKSNISSSLQVESHPNVESMLSVAKSLREERDLADSLSRQKMEQRNAVSFSSLYLL